MSRAIPAEPALRGSSRVVVPFTGPPLKTSRCEHTRVPVNSKDLAASAHVLTLRETFQIARGAADEETVVARELERDGIVAHGEGAPVDYWGETPDGHRRARSRPTALALLGDDLFAGEAILARVAAWDGPQGAKMALDGARPRLARQARSGSRRGALLGTRPRHAADLVHDRDRLRRGHRRPDAPRDRLRGAQDQGRRARRPRAAAGRAGARPARGCGSTATRAGTSTPRASSRPS